MCFHPHTAAKASMNKVLELQLTKSGIWGVMHKGPTLPMRNGYNFGDLDSSKLKKTSWLQIPTRPVDSRHFFQEFQNQCRILWSWNKSDGITLALCCITETYKLEDSQQKSHSQNSASRILLHFPMLRHLSLASTNQNELRMHLLHLMISDFLAISK